MKAGAKECGCRSGGVGGRRIGDDKEFASNVLEEDEGERFDGVATESGWEKEKVARIPWSEAKMLCQAGKKLDIILEAG